MATKKTAAKKAPSKKAAPKKASVKKAAPKKAAPKKAVAKKAPVKKAAPKKAAAKKAARKKAAPKKAAPKKAAPTKTVVKKAAPTKAVAKKAAPKKAAPAKATPPTAKAVSAVPKPAAKPAEPKPPKPVKYPFDAKFLDSQRALLLSERARLAHDVEALTAEANALAELREPGDVQFDEESGEGDTLAVERERDLALSAQFSVQIEEIDRAMAKIGQGTYGMCEISGQPIPRERLKAIPWAREKVEYKVGNFRR